MLVALARVALVELAKTVLLAVELAVWLDATAAREELDAIVVLEDTWARVELDVTWALEAEAAGAATTVALDEALAASAAEAALFEEAMTSWNLSAAACLAPAF